MPRRAVSKSQSGVLVLSRPVSETDPLWQQGEHILFSRKFLLENGDRIREIALRARLPILLIGTCLVLAVAFWGRRLYGPTPALAASALAAFSPNLIAHAKLATTDLGCTAAMFLSVFTCYQAIEKNTHTSWFLCGFVTGLALLTKFTALLLGPIYLVLGGMFYFQKRISFRHLLRGAFIVTMLSTLTIGAGYNLTFNLSLYFEGLSKIYSNARPGYLFYLHGELSETPWWYYYLATLYLKVPLPVLVLVALSLFYLFKTSQHRDTALVLLVPILVILIATCFDQSNLGLRRIYLMLAEQRHHPLFAVGLGKLHVVAVLIFFLHFEARLYNDFHHRGRLAFSHLIPLGLHSAG